MAIKKVKLKNMSGDQLIPDVGIPSQAGNNGKVLGTNGSSLQFVDMPTVTSTYTATGTDAVNGVAVSNAIATKQDNLVSGTNIKTVNGTSLLGSGNIALPTVNNATLTIQENGSNVATFTANASSNVTANIRVPTTTSSVTSGYSAALTSDGAYTHLVRRKSKSAATGSASQGVYVDANGQVQTCTAVTSTYAATGTAPVNGVAVSNAIATKQDSLVSGTNIKTINGTSLLGSGDIVIQSAPNLDNKSITKNTANELQTVGVINQNNASPAVKTWTGTKAEYDAIVTKDSGTLYYLTDVQKIYYGNTLVCEKFNRNIGEIITSSIPLTDAGLHLLDGSLIQGGGIYDDFVQYIAGLVNTYPQCFCSEAEWQQSVNTYGVCGKFVYSNNSVRLPKITGFIEGTIDSNALGDLVEAGLPNITGSCSTDIGNSIRIWVSDAQGAIYGDNYTTENSNDGQVLTTGVNKPHTIRFDASRSSSIYGNSNTVQPQSIKVFYYIVVANSTKTNIEVDIDEIVTDLNSKANNADVVHLAGTETISGNKKFTGMTIFDRPISAGSSDLSGDVVTTEAMLKANDDTMYNYVKLGNGLLIQWGHIQQNSQQLNITFPIPFMNTAYRMFTQDAGVASGYSYAGVTGIGRTTTGATLYSYYANRYYDWLAIGFWY